MEFGGWGQDRVMSEWPTTRQYESAALCPFKSSFGLNGQSASVKPTGQFENCHKIVSHDNKSKMKCKA